MSSKNILKAFTSTPFRSRIFKGKTVLITGGGTGLGKKMAQSYLGLGANVIIASRKEDVLKNACNELGGGSRINYGIIDLKSEESTRNFIESMEIIPDIVVNNAAGNFLCPSHELSHNGWNSILDSVLRGTFDLTLEIGKKMIENKKTGTFLNISTTYANTGSAFVLPSAVAKAGCNNLTKSLASEWGQYGIRLNSIAPGPIFTEGAFSRLDPDNRFENAAIKRLPLGRLGQPEELANLACFITSDYMNWMTGQVINLDGGEVVGNSGEFNFLLPNR